MKIDTKKVMTVKHRRGKNIAYLVVAILAEIFCVAGAWLLQNDPEHSLTLMVAYVTIGLLAFAIYYGWSSLPGPTDFALLLTPKGFQLRGQPMIVWDSVEKIAWNHLPNWGYSLEVTLKKRTKERFTWRRRRTNLPHDLMKIGLDDLKAAVFAYYRAACKDADIWEEPWARSAKKSKL